MNYLNKVLNTFNFLITAMSGNHFIHYVFIVAFLWCGVVFANEEKTDSTASSGGNQIIVSPINILLDLGESGYANALVLDKNGNPVEGRELQVIPQDRAKISISSDSLITSGSGSINFFLLGRQQGETAITISDGVISAQINVTIRNLLQYLLPYFYGDMQLSLINPTQDINYIKIQFHENSDRHVPPVIIRLEGKEMRNIKLSEETGIILKDGWVEIMSTEVMFGGTWTNKGYLSLYPVKENF
jgi:hypothetical protein